MSLSPRSDSPRPPVPAVRVDRAAVLTAPRTFEQEARPTPSPAAGQLRLRLEGCGVCASSLPAWQGREWFAYPFAPGMLGHEGWGTVEAVGPDVSRDWLGQRVATWADGAFSEHICVSESEAVAIPDTLAGPVPVEPLGCAVNVVRRARVEPGMRVAVVGVGFLGALLIQLLQAAGCEVYAVARRPFAQQLAKRLGARGVVPFDSPGEVGERLGKLGVEAFPRVFEVAGVEASLDVSSPLVDFGGALIVAGYHQDGLRSVNLQDWNWKGIDVINAHERDPAVVRRGMEEAVAACERGEIDLAPLLTHRYRPADLDRAFHDLESRPDGFLKGWVDFTLQPGNDS